VTRVPWLALALALVLLPLGARAWEEERALADLAQLRELEAERAAAQTRLDFYQSKADGLQERIAKSYEGDVGALWDVAQQQNAEAAALRRLDLRLTAQRRQAAHHAGDRWEPLFDDLAERRPLPE
jgi:hypothetical protein